MRLKPIWKRYIAVAVGLFIAPLNLHAQSQTPRAEIDRSRIEVLVLGTYHLRDHDFNRIPIDTGAVRRRLSRFRPDHVVVEWLHPSINPTTPNLYYSFPDLETLKRLWGYSDKDVNAELARVGDILTLLKTRGLLTAETRVELGKLYYLSRDVLNAGYQWWIAKRLGSNVRDLQRLTFNNFEGHELAVYGFPIAYEQGLEYITPFDYMGTDAEWDAVEQRIFSRIRAIAIQAKHGVTENNSDPRWRQLAEEFYNLARAYNDNGDPAFMTRYAGIREVDEAVAAFIDNRREGREFERRFSGADSLAAMRYLASDEFIARERRGYYERIAGVSVDGLGSTLVRNYEHRNRRMIDFIEQDIPRLNSRKVLIIVGSGHRLFLEEQLRARGYRVVPALNFLR